MATKDMLDPNPFAKSLLAKEGNSTARDIYTAVGFALDRWERCEVAFGTLYSSLVKPRGGTHTLMRAFGVIAASSARYDIIFAAADAYFAVHIDEGLHKRARHLLNLYKSAASRRNEIAHAVVDGKERHRIVNNKAEPLPTIWFLVPPLFATRKNEMFHQGPKYRYSTKEVSHFTACFEELGSRASKLTQDIRAFYEALPEKHD